MGVIAGIDEAGFGPVLGPLVVSTVAFRLPEASRDADLWSLLGSTVTRKPSRRAGTLAIGDSKKLYHRKRPNALAHLERAVLAALATRGVRVGSLRELLSAVAPGAEARLAEYPWYAEAELPLPHCISATDVALAGNALASALGDAGASLAALRAEVVCVGEYNRMVQATNNKATALFDVNSRLFAQLWGSLWRGGSPGAVTLWVDRHGGRIHYRRPLQRLFPRCEFKIVAESDTRSSYRIAEGPRAMDIHFGVEFDRLHLPVALASMTCKYLRELFMVLLNRFWAERVGGLAPTAGYYTDGRRFLGEIDQAIREADVRRDLLQRCR